MGPAPIQRRKSGCWTCRLRRKRCSEGGPPCINCVDRQVYCHGYGPKPEWKDKGEKERQEAIRLQLRTPNAPRRRISSATHSNPRAQSAQTVTSASSMDAGSLISPPLERALSTCSTDVEIDLSLDVNLDRILFGEEWSTFEHHGMNTLPVQPASLPTPITPNVRFSLATCEPHLTHQSSEREMDLVMYYLDHVFPQLQGPHLNQPRGWLLSALMASPGFYFAAIGTSAYCQHRDAQGDSGLRAVAYHDYQCYRSRSSKLFSDGSWGNIPGEALICAVHLYRLEVSLTSCPSYGLL
ncbi:PRO1A C6 Zink-finger protein [Colletotrichum asianum]|uniref:PRO1A C6 Zink-finger protein n=1 Tax=Colletotrichum asianum TaxID=702518 RepID=A0A8H3W1T4_9PEZI|nr:PRO1A C6 Zink-finger protein [Colletotrichum asianum]